MKRFGLLLATILTCLVSRAQIEVKEFKLSNGMTVWVNEDHSQPKVFGAVVVRAGAKDCPNTGIAHYFEHIMFKGTDRIGTIDYQAEKPWLDSISAQYDLLSQTKNDVERSRIQQKINELSIKAADFVIPNEFNRLISKYGGSSLNAGTGYDMTYYHNEFLPQFIEQWCWLNSERLMNPVYRGFQGELENVYEEKNRSADDTGDALEKVMQFHVCRSISHSSGQHQITLFIVIAHFDYSHVDFAEITVTNILCQLRQVIVAIVNALLVDCRTRILICLIRSADINRIGTCKHAVKRFAGGSTSEKVYFEFSSGSMFCLCFLCNGCTNCFWHTYGGKTAHANTKSILNVRCRLVGSDYWNAHFCCLFFNCVQSYSFCGKNQLVT